MSALKTKAIPVLGLLPRNATTRTICQERPISVNMDTTRRILTIFDISELFDTISRHELPSDFAHQLCAHLHILLHGAIVYVAAAELSTHVKCVTLDRRGKFASPRYRRVEACEERGTLHFLAIREKSCSATKRRDYIYLS